MASAMKEGSEHMSEASSAGVDGGSKSNSQHGQKPGGNQRRRRRKKGSSHGGSDHGEGSPKSPPPLASASKEGSSAKKSAAKNRSRSPKGRHSHGSRHGPKSPKPAADMCVIVNSVYLWDVAKKNEDEDDEHQDSYHRRHHLHHYHQQVAPYHFAENLACSNEDAPAIDTNNIVTIRAPHPAETCRHHVVDDRGFSVIDTSFPNPHPPSVVHDKYWYQRRRLFSRFDMGVQLDSEGWFSVTPEIIADHVAKRVSDFADLCGGGGMVVLDAFCGCGGNAIAFGKVPPDKISLVVCVDIDRSKLRKAAYNASLYDIPNDKLIFVECNTMFLLMNCYKGGKLVIDQLDANVASMPSLVEIEDYAGYRIGGLESLPPRIDAVFMDPPWGGVDYSRQNSYDLEKNMKILIGPSEPPEATIEGIADDFFDTFSTRPSHSKKGIKLYNEAKEGEYANGVDLVKMAAAATKSHLVIYDLPRNTSKTSIGRSALAAGYRGNVKLEEHYLNGRLKTVTAYLGDDYCSLLDERGT